MGVAEYEIKNIDLVEACIYHIASEIDRVMGNVSQQEYNLPIYNYGTQFEIPEFKMRAYDWGYMEESHPEDDEPPANFEWRDFKFWWYKRLGRGGYANREISNDELAEMCKECREAVYKLEKKLEPYEEFFRSDQWKYADFDCPELGVHIR